jgi:prophage antirepressor-like protein
MSSQNVAVFNFDGKFDVRTIQINGDVLFVAKDVAVALGYANTVDAVGKHCKHAKSLIDLGVANRDPLDPQTKLIPESDVYRMTLRSKLPSADKFQDWVCEEVLPSIRKTGSYNYQPPVATQPLYTVDIKLKIGREAMECLRMSDTSKIRLLSDISKSEGVEPNYLPSYVDEDFVQSLTTLLKSHGSTLSAKAVNPILIDMGLLEERERPSAGGTVKRFKCLTDEGLKFGRNETSPQNPREVQPLYYEREFPALLRMIEDHIHDDSE